MRQIVLGALTLLTLLLAAWASQQPRPVADAVRNATAVPAAFGPIQPRLSADGRQIAFSYQGALWRMARQGGPMTRLTQGTGYDIEPAWSHDAELIAYVNSPGMGRGRLEILRTQSGLPVKLPTTVRVLATEERYAKLDFHPDGRLFGNFRVDGQEGGLSLLDIGTGKLKRLARPDLQSRFALSPDGKWLAYTTVMDREGEQSGNDGPQADIWKVSTVDGTKTKITRFASRIFDLCWSADNRALYVASDLGGAHNDLWRVPLDDPEHGVERLTSGQADEDRPSVDAQGRWLLYIDNRAGPTALVVRNLEQHLDTTVVPTALDFQRMSGGVRLSLRDRSTGRPVTARVSLRDEAGKFHAPPGALYRIVDDYRDGHFYCSEPAEWQLPAGKYAFRVFRGPEYRVARGGFVVGTGKTTPVEISLERWADEAARGWYSGENHIHANYGYGEWYNTPQSLLEQCGGEDLRVCHFMVANSDSDGVFDREFFRGRPDALSTKETTLFWNEEFRSTFWGHMTLIGLKQVVEPVFTGFKDTTNPWDWPTNGDIADRTHLQHAVANYTHATHNPDDPYLGAYTAKGLPVDVALGKIDTLDLNRSYAATVPLWYRLLNCGFKLSASAGTDCFLNRVRSQLPGGDRVYVKVDGEFTYQAWLEGLRAGRSFVTNGPMLELTIDDRGIGDTVRLAGPGTVHVRARARSQFPLERMEVVYNGQIAAKGTVAADRESHDLDVAIPVSRSGWFSFRVAGRLHPDHAAGPLEAHTSPIYLQVAGKPTASRDDARFFLAWIERLSVALRVRDRLPSPQIKQQVQDQLEAARAVYARLAQTAD